MSLKVHNSFIANCKILQTLSMQLPNSQLFFFFFLAMLLACGFSVPQTRIKPMPPCTGNLEVWSLNHWTDSEVPQYSTFSVLHFGVFLTPLWSNLLTVNEMQKYLPQQFINIQFYLYYIKFMQWEKITPFDHSNTTYFEVCPPFISLPLGLFQIHNYFAYMTSDFHFFPQLYHKTLPCFYTLQHF